MEKLQNRSPLGVPKFITLLMVVSAALALTLYSEYANAAGEGHHHNGHSDGHGHGHHEFSFGAPGIALEVTREIVVVMKDNLYEPKELSVKDGETIRFKIINKGEFLHEFGIATVAMHAEHQKQMAVMLEHGMIEMDRINHERMKMSHGDGGHTMKHDDPNSVLVEPGKSTEIIWKFAKDEGIEFACNIPGHYESGMVGPIHFK
mgnify:CR=1 FL=1